MPLVSANKPLYAPLAKAKPLERTPACEAEAGTSSVFTTEPAGGPLVEPPPPPEGGGLVDEPEQAAGGGQGAGLGMGAGSMQLGMPLLLESMSQLRARSALTRLVEPSG